MSKPFQICGGSIILYQGNEILLQQRKDNGCWGYHGGHVELGEFVEETAKRELFEETGLTAKSIDLLGVFSGPELHHIYPDGNEVYIVDVVYLCGSFAGDLAPQAAEVADLKWFDISHLPENISPPCRPALRAYLKKYSLQL